jgi:hypothetical protein
MCTYVCTYIDWIFGDNEAPLHTYCTESPPIEITTPLWDQGEVYDAELGDIKYAAEECSRQLRRIFTDN